MPGRARLPGFEPPYPAGWFDRLLDWIDRTPAPNWLHFVGLLLLQLGYMTGMLWWNGKVPIGSIDPSRVFVVVVTPYLLWVRFQLDHVACRALDDFRPALAVDDRELMRMRYELTTLPARTTWLVTVACLSLAAVNWILIPESLLDPYAGSRGRALVEFGLIAMSTSTAAGVTIVHALHQLGMVQRLHDRVATIRLLRTKPLYAFSGLTARTGASLLLLVYFFAAVRPDLVFGSPTLKAVFAAIVPTAIACFVLPLRGIHRRIAAEKDRALAATAERLETVLARLHERVDQANLGVTANMSATTSATAQFGIGPNSNFEGNLVPLTAGLAYEENPTIAYAPVQGERYAKSVLAPIDLETLILLLNVERPPDHLISILVRQVNGLPNRLYGPPAARSAFQEAMAVLSELEGAGQAAWTSTSGEGDSFALVIHDYTSANRVKVRDLLRRLGLPESLAQRDRDIVLPVALAIGTTTKAGLALQTRSVYDLIQLAASAVEVPPEHAAQGIAGPALGEVSPLRGILTVHSSSRFPSEPVLVAIRHRGHWFYVLATDDPSKLAFRLIQTLIGMHLVDPRSPATPTLTIPVGK